MSSAKRCDRARGFRLAAGFAISLAATLGAYAGDDSQPVDGFELRSPAFREGAGIPARHTCQGDDVSYALRWSDPPKGTRSFVLIVDDPDAPDPAAPRRTWVHWVLYDIPPEARGLPAGVVADGLPPGTRQGLNDWRRTGYGGPCPPIGRHRYLNKLYALDSALGELAKPDKARIERAMQGHVLAEAVLIGTYQKQ